MVVGNLYSQRPKSKRKLCPFCRRLVAVEIAGRLVVMVPRDCVRAAASCRKKTTISRARALVKLANASPAARSTWGHCSGFIPVVGTKVITRRLAVS
jgi:hypothetical protein